MSDFRYRDLGKRSVSQGLITPHKKGRQDQLAANGETDMINEIIKHCPDLRVSELEQLTEDQLMILDATDTRWCARWDEFCDSYTSEADAVSSAFYCAYLELVA